MRPCGRIIPAGAGSTPYFDPHRYKFRDHPRRCGEHTCEIQMSRRIHGSSPQVRGARTALGCGRQSAGIIPAGAGSTRYETLIRSLSRDHPRRCGEHVRCRHCYETFNGSSPQVRGALNNYSLDQQYFRIIPAGAGSTGLGWPIRARVGIIPAGAGSTPPARSSHASPRDHPRRCGEHAIYLKPLD